MNIAYYFILLRDYNILYVCMYVCVHTHTHTHTHLFVFVCICVCMYVYIYVCVCACVRACVCVCMYLWLCFPFNSCPSWSSFTEICMNHIHYVFTGCWSMQFSIKISLFFNQPNTHSETNPLNFKTWGCEMKIILWSSVSEVLKNLKAVFKFSCWRSLTQKITNVGLSSQIFTKFRRMNRFFQVAKWLYLIVVSNLDLLYRV